MCSGFDPLCFLGVGFLKVFMFVPWCLQRKEWSWDDSAALVAQDPIYRCLMTVIVRRHEGNAL